MVWDLGLRFGSFNIWDLWLKIQDLVRRAGRSRLEGFECRLPGVRVADSSHYRILCNLDSLHSTIALPTKHPRNLNSPPNPKAWNLTPRSPKAFNAGLLLSFKAERELELKAAAAKAGP